MFNLTNKTSIITGAGSGIGKAMATLFAKQGSMVYIVDLDENGSMNTLDEIKKDEGNASFIKCDISSSTDVQQAIQEITSHHSSIDILVNNAGIAHVGNAENTSEEDFDRLYSVNVKGVFNMAKVCIPLMKEKGGSILNLASIASSIGLPDRFSLSINKTAGVGF
jgi:2-keto-3-deoxy-L-fuconate dehydrogenase